MSKKGVNTTQKEGNRIFRLDEQTLACSVVDLKVTLQFKWRRFKDYQPLDTSAYKFDARYNKGAPRSGLEVRHTMLVLTSEIAT